MVSFDNYRNRFETIAFRREDGILEMRLHSDGGPLQWSLTAHDELEQAFLDLSRDAENKVLLLTGTGGEFSGPEVPAGASAARRISAAEFAEIVRVGRRLQLNCLEVPVPMIAAVNGPARRHPELPLLADIVLMSEDALFQDSAHFRGGMVPGDGVHVVFPHLMGKIRASYFLMTAQEIGATEAKALGLANEVLPAARLMDRAWELAREIAAQPDAVRRETRAVLNRELKDLMHAYLEHGLEAEARAHQEQQEERE
ncbi:enoyl-CoA hydratase/isomerase family protein [Oceanicola sp. 502str15]|uniref:enoyl-CoA hydratase/isomerase family protein n=1 Tax=Oceanicola sp. 502str15 TaxID=2696061 RepID=UPI002095DC4A|nr:enoyl-CoA hydratase/isomerase family protein [Oceanicola sp. 502str15]MCO6385319.1 enoyl-CoA hydratase/isomerase family protein [Oceanicola sp. 502str15]